MNNEMMLFQARQDFIDMHKDLVEGKQISLEKYDQIVADLKSMDDVNFELILRFVEEVEQINIKQMWQFISALIEEIKAARDWSERKEEQICWKNGQVEWVAKGK